MAEDETTNEVAVEQRFLKQLNKEILMTDVAAVQRMRNIIDSGSDEAVQLDASNKWLGLRQKSKESQQNNSPTVSVSFGTLPDAQAAMKKDLEVFDVEATVSEGDGS